ncbi:MAG: type 4a pilus biogenesis protein PilO [Chloroflexi bacterium]|nr:type 4a pilus biogenesis protein PilO [Chloroflexota bacterium]
MVKLPLKINRKTLIVLAAVLVVEILSVIVFAIHQQSMLSQLDDQYKAMNDQLIASRKLGDSLKAAQVQLESDKTQLKQLEMALPSRDYLPTLLVQLQKLAKDTNNAITSVTPSALQPTPPAAGAAPGGAAPDGAPPAGGPPPAAAPASAPPPAAGTPPAGAPAAGTPAPGGPAGTPAQPGPDSYDRYNLGMSIDGSYRSVMTFLLRLAAFPKIISVDQFQLHSSGSAVPGQDTMAGATLTCTAYIVKGS